MGTSISTNNSFVWAKSLLAKKYAAGSMIGENFLYLLFWIPAALWCMLNFIALQSGYSDGSITADNVSGVISTWLLILFPLIAITGPANMGISYVMRSWARDEHAYPVADFFEGLKKNWKPGLLFSLMDGARLWHFWQPSTAL